MLRSSACRSLHARITQVPILAFALAFLVVVATCAAAPGQFIGLHGVDSQPSRAIAVSSDGDTIVGTLLREASFWHGGPPGIGLGVLDDACCGSSASSVSADGRAIVGTTASKLSNRAGSREAFRWTPDSGMMGLGVLRAESDRFSSGATDISDDGETIVGWSTDVATGSEPFIWREHQAMQGLGLLHVGSPEFTVNSANSVSADGNVAVGVSNNGVGYEAFRWTEGTGMVGLGDLPGGGLMSVARDVSATGDFIVGEGTSDMGIEAFLWTAGDGMTALGDLPGGDYASLALAISSDGSFVLGRSHAEDGWSAFIWDRAHGMQDLRTVLIDRFGLDVTGWHLTQANSISADGLTIVGDGINPFGQQEAWVARVPEPGTSAICLAGTVLLLSSAARWTRCRR